MKKMRLSAKASSIGPLNSLTDYKDAVRDIDKREMVLREEYNFKHYDGFKTFTDTTFMEEN